MSAPRDECLQLIRSMLFFQKKNNIKHQCVYNSYLVYNEMKKRGYNNFRYKAVVVVSMDLENSQLKICEGHIVIEDETNTMYEASYDILAFGEQAEYFDNINKLIIYYPCLKLRPEWLKKIIKAFLEFNKIANNLNDGNYVLTADHGYNYQIYLEQKKYCLRADRHIRNKN